MSTDFIQIYIGNINKSFTILQISPRSNQIKKGGREINYCAKIYKKYEYNGVFLNKYTNLTKRVENAAAYNYNGIEK